MHISCRLLVKFCSADIWRLCMYISILPAISTEGESIRGNMLSIKEPPSPRKRKCTYKNASPCKSKQKNISNRKKKKRPERQCNTRGNILACPKNPRKKLSRRRNYQGAWPRKEPYSSKRKAHENGWIMLIIIIIITGRRNWENRSGQASNRSSQMVRARAIKRFARDANWTQTKANQTTEHKG